MTTNVFLGIARGQVDAVGDQVVANTSSAGTAVDVEVRIQLLSGANGPTTDEAVFLLETIRNYILNKGIESLPGTNLPPQTYPG